MILILSLGTAFGQVTSCSVSSAPAPFNTQTCSSICQVVGSGLSSRFECAPTNPNQPIELTGVSWYGGAGHSFWGTHDGQMFCCAYAGGASLPGGIYGSTQDDTFHFQYGKYDLEDLDPATSQHFNPTYTLASLEGDDTVFPSRFWGAGRSPMHFLGEGNDTFVGSDGVNRVDAGPGDDTISAYTGDGASVYGGPGADVIVGGDSPIDFLYGDYPEAGSTPDWVVPPSGSSGSLFSIQIFPDLAQYSSTDVCVDDPANADDIRGGDGDDVIFGNCGPDKLYGGSTWDVASEGRNWIVGGSGDDHLFGGSEDDELYGGEGDDGLWGVLYGTPGGSDFMFGGAGNDTLVARGNRHEDDQYFFGGDGDDVIWANLEPHTGGEVEIYGDAVDVQDASNTPITPESRSGSDLIVTRIGVALARGGGDVDFMYGGGGADEFYGDHGADIIYGCLETVPGWAAEPVPPHSGNPYDPQPSTTTAAIDCDHIYDEDRLYGGKGEDTIRGGRGRDLLDGGEGIDQLLGEGEGDLIFGGSEGDSIWGDSSGQPVGNDCILGDGGQDTLRGGGGSDVIMGGKDYDKLYGEAGKDVLCDEHGDLYFGGSESDALWHPVNGATPDPSSVANGGSCGAPPNFSFDPTCNLTAISSQPGQCFDPRTAPAAGTSACANWFP